MLGKVRGKSDEAFSGRPSGRICLPCSSPNLSFFGTNTFQDTHHYFLLSSPAKSLLNIPAILDMEGSKKWARSRLQDFCSKVVCTINIKFGIFFHSKQERFLQKTKNETSVVSEANTFTTLSQMPIENGKMGNISGFLRASRINFHP